MAGQEDGLRKLCDSLLFGEDVEAQSSASIEVRRLSYFLPANPASRRRRPRRAGGASAAPQPPAPPAERVVLSGVSCTFSPGRLAAIMGASGSGKTSLLTLLRGLSSPGARVEGEVLCNGQNVHIDRMRTIASVVPQEDVFPSALTPREMLAFAAELRLPESGWSEEARARRVDLVLQLLGLETCASTPIGDGAEGLRGISGGERRRLSIGLSIIGGLPQLLLCDEPTTGLDSASAAGIMSILAALANRGVTVICAIHQPSFDIFRQFSSLLLLEAGRAAYFGSVMGAGAGGSAAEGVEAYFQRHGAAVPEHTNPAHHYISEIRSNSELWAHRWATATAAQDAALAVDPSFASGSAGNGAAKQPCGAVGRDMHSLQRQAGILIRRTLLENFRNRKKFFRGVMSRFPASIVIGLFFWRMAAEPTQQSIFMLKGIMFVGVQSPFVETFYAGATATQLTRGLLRREYYDGLYQVTAFYIAYYVGFLMMQVPWTFAWCIPMYILVGLPLEVGQIAVFLLTIFLILLTATAAGSVVGTWSKDADGNRAVLMPCFIPMVLFSGYVIPQAQIPLVWKPIYYASPLQWAISILETSRYSGVVFEDCDASLPRSARACLATGEELLEEQTTPLARALGVRGMLLLMAGYTAFFMLLNHRTIRRHILNGVV